MKKYFWLFIVAMLMMSLTACDGSTTSTPNKESVNNTGKGEVRDGISTDEELVAHEEEVKSYEEASEEPSEIDYSDVNVETETMPTASDTYISADDFWQGEDYFDLEEYLWVNGADEVIPCDSHEDPVEETGNDVASYRADFFDGQWSIMICHGVCFIVRMSDYKTYGCPGMDNSDTVTVDIHGTKVTRENLNRSIIMVQSLKEHHDEEDPLIDSGLDYN